jgi:arogenate dehydrogenase (NADP+)
LQSREARKLGVDFYPHFDSTNFYKDLDVIILSVPMIDFEQTIDSIPAGQLTKKLLVDVCPLNVHPKQVMLKAFADFPDIDILCTNPMFGPVSKNGEIATSGSGTNLWDGRPMVYERVRISDMPRCDRYLKIFEEARCQVVEMAAEQHDSSTADAEFVTHMIGRLLDQKLLPPTPVMSKEYAALCEVADMTSGDSFDLFFGMYKYSERASEHLTTMRDNLAAVERQLAAREAYLAAKAEMRNSERQTLLAETRLLLQEIAKSGFASGAGIAVNENQKVDTTSEDTEDLTDYDP